MDRFQTEAAVLTVFLQPCAHLRSFIIIVFAIACLIVVCCLCIASTNWRDDRHDYELDDIRDKSDENK